MTKLFLILFLSTSAFAQTFTPLEVMTTKFKFKTDGRLPTTENARVKCVFTSYLNDDKTAILLRMGVADSNFDYFGWNMNIPLADFPLKQNYTREFKEVGNSSMVLTYVGNKLSFKWIKKDGLWSLLYPFELTIDPALTKPERLKATVEGYDADMFGRPKKHISQDCTFSS